MVVPPPVFWPVAFTVIVPVMIDGWILHTYGKVPSVLNVKVPLFPGCIGPTSNPVPEGSCSTAPLLTHFTVVPTLIVRFAGFRLNSQRKPRGLRPVELLHLCP